VSGCQNLIVSQTAGPISVKFGRKAQLNHLGKIAIVQTPAITAIFHPEIAKTISRKALSVRVILICSGHRLLRRDSDKGFDYASTSPESLLHQIIIAIRGCLHQGLNL